jgi:hypothetical protein
MINLLLNPFDTLWTDDRGYVYSARSLLVSTATFPIEKSDDPEYQDTKHIRIDIFDFEGAIKNGAEHGKYYWAHRPTFDNKNMEEKE